MKKLIFSTPLILAAAFGLAACMDTDAQYNIPQVDAPALVSTYPASGETVSASDKGELTLTVKYNKRVFFASSTYNKIQFFVRLSDHIGRLSCNRLMIQSVKEGLPFESRKVKSGEPGQRLEFVYAYRVHKKRRNSHTVSELFRKISPEVGRMLTIRRMLYILYYCVIHLVCA